VSNLELFEAAKAASLRMQAAYKAYEESMEASRRARSAETAASDEYVAVEEESLEAVRALYAATKVSHYRVGGELWQHRGSGIVRVEETVLSEETVPPTPSAEGRGLRWL
jgi:hypothetical protein